MAVIRALRRQRLDRARTRHQLVALGAPRSGLTILCQSVVSVPLWGLLAIVFGVYIGLNMVFAGLSLFDPGGITHVKPGDFPNAVFNSVQIISTVGYGAMEPISPYANAVGTLEYFSTCCL